MMNEDFFEDEDIEKGEEVKTVVEKLSEYLDDNNFELETINLPEDKTLPDVKSDVVLLADLYIKHFGEFKKAFAECKINGVPKYMAFHQNIFNELLRLTSALKSGCEFGKSRSNNMLREFVVKNHSDISDFIDFYGEVGE